MSIVLRIIPLIILAVPEIVLACDPCTLFSASRLHGHRAGSTTVSISEQHTEYRRSSEFAENSTRDEEFVKDYSTTQFSIAHDISERFGLQLTLPIIARSFDRIVNYRESSDSDIGLGDISLLGSFSLLNSRDVDHSIIVGASAGIKLPTGDTGVLEDFSEAEGGNLESTLLKHHQISSSSGGKTLTFGSGSYDFIFGFNALGRYARALAVANIQYTLRQEGDFNYKFADDLLWSVAPGYYVYVEHDLTIAALLNLSGEYKTKDRLSGVAVNGSASSNVYLGPGLLFVMNERLGLEIGVDFRVSAADADSTIVPKARILASLSYQFS